MRTIWKYPLQVTAVQIISMPSDAEVVHLALQDGSPYLWVIMDVKEDGKTPLCPMKQIQFAIHGTGHPIPDRHDYIGTFLQGPFVWHVFLVVE